jgi:predicted peptidase
MPAILLALLALEVGAVNGYQEMELQHKTKDGVTQTIKYRLLKPEKIEAGKKYPVVLYLHGAGERGNDNVSQLKFFPTWMAEADRRAKYPCFVIAPQCPNNEKWVNSPWDKKTSQPLQPEMTEPIKAAVEMLDAVIAENPVDKDRVYLTGLSMGGYGTWDLAARMPERFAAAAPICGGGDDKQAERLTKLPIWAWHGGADPIVPPQRTRQMIEAIKKAGGSPKFTEIPGVGHDSWTKAYTSPDGLIPWLFEQTKSGK